MLSNPRLSQSGDTTQSTDRIGFSPHARRNLVEWYCQLQLRAYRTIFKPDEEVSALDNTSRRYAWLKRLLKIHDEEHAHIFPPAWDVSRVLCMEFCQGTRFDNRSSKLFLRRSHEQTLTVLFITNHTIHTGLILQIFLRKQLQRLKFHYCCRSCR